MMTWPYHFLDLTPAQQYERRELIDSYARLAQVSALGPLLVVQCYFLVCSFRKSWRRDASASPQLKDGRCSQWNGIAVVWRRFSWWCGEAVEPRGLYLGRRGDVLAAVALGAWLGFCCFASTGEGTVDARLNHAQDLVSFVIAANVYGPADYLHLTRRFGLVAASQLPLHYLLAFRSPAAYLHSQKPPWLPLQIITRTSHEILNSYHQLLGRIITVLFYCHAGMFLNLYVQKALLASKVRQGYIICGILGVVCLTTIGTTALGPVREWNYRVFYITHVVLASVLLPLLWFHVAHIRVYLYEAAAVYAFNVFLRSRNTRSFEGKVKLVPGNSLVEVSIPVMEKEYLRRWSPGQHAYLSLDGNTISRTFKNNPFSAASIPSAGGHLHFVARILDGNTAKLAATASSKGSTQRITVEGPYGVQDHADKLLQYDRILLVAGGVGGTFIVPLYCQLLSDLSPSRGSYRRQKVNFLWSVRSKDDVSWALPHGEREKAGFVERLRVFVTGSSAHDENTSNGHIATSKDGKEHDMSNTSNGQVAAYKDDDQHEAGFNEPDDSIEMEDQKSLLSEDEHTQSTKDSANLSTYAGRPDLKRIVDRTFSYSPFERVAIFVCGPGSLSRSLRREVGRWVRRGRDVWFWEEGFAL